MSYIVRENKKDMSAEIQGAQTFRLWLVCSAKKLRKFEHGGEHTKRRKERVCGKGENSQRAERGWDL
jgi:hypothetical protein